MSEDKLQEILNKNSSSDEIELMRLAYNKGLEDASKSAEIELELKSDGETVHKIRVSKQSILKLKIK